MEHQFACTRKGLARACSTLAFGVAAVLGAAAPAWSQESRTSETRAGASKPGAAMAEAMKRCSKEVFGHPMHTTAVTEARQEVELLEVKIAAKRARIRAAEARLQQAKEGEKDILQAELDAERAELLEPELLRKHAQARLKEAEQASESGAMCMGHMHHMAHMGRMDMGMEHPAMGMGMMGHPMAHHWAMMRDLQIENNLNLLRVAVERLESEVDGILEGSIKPGSGLKATPSTGDATASGESTGASTAP